MWGSWAQTCLAQRNRRIRTPSAEADKNHLLGSSSHIGVRRLRCGDSQRDYYAHDVQHSDAWEGGGGGEKGEGERRNRMGRGRKITRSSLEQQTSPGGGRRCAAAHSRRSWGGPEEENPEKTWVWWLWSTNDITMYQTVCETEIAFQNGQGGGQSCWGGCKT